MNEQQERAVRAGLKRLADRTREASASEGVERAVLAEFGRAAGSGRLKPASTVGYSFAALAAALLLVVGAAVWLVRGEPASPAVAVQPGGFVAVPGAAALPEMESGNIVRVSLPVASLPVYGVAIPTGVFSDSVQAELLIAQDGQARAIRLVDRSIDSRSMNND